MDFKISVSANRTFVLIKVLKPMTTEISMAFGPEMMKVAEENNINSFLFDVRGCPNVQSTIKNYDFAYKDIDTFTFPRASRSAFLIDEGDKSHDFITTLFLNAGFEVKQFVNEKDAIDWLEKDSGA